MANTTKTTKAIEPEETIERPEANPYERVPYTLEMNWENPESDRIVYVGVGDYSAYLERGKMVMIPRYVANFLDQQKADEEAAKMERLRLQNEFRKAQGMGML